VNLIPRKPGEPLPATLSLGLVCAFFFVLFNQLMMGLVAYLKTNEGLVEEAGRFEGISVGIGALWSALALIVFLKIKVFKSMDAIVCALAIAVVAVSWSERLLGLGEQGFVVQFALGNLILGVWLGRKLGLLRA